MSDFPLSPTDRTTIRRHADRSRDDRADLLEVLDAGLICHLGVVVGGAPLVLPTGFGVDLAGPDRAGTLYLHGSSGAVSLRSAIESDICVTITCLDGLVLARSAFNHSMNYRSAVVRGRARLVDDPTEQSHALDLIVDHAVPGRMKTLRGHSRKELAATNVLALPLYEASVKRRSGGPRDDPEDVVPGVWAGVITLSVRAGGVQTAPDAEPAAVPEHVRARAASLA